MTAVKGAIETLSTLLTLGLIFLLGDCTEKLVSADPGDPIPVEPIQAFPGALGYGAGTIGGAGGRIIYVTNHNDSGPGSLRNCLLEEGERVCVFAVGGVFRFTTRPPLIENPFLTIAGQTAPGGSVVITHAGGSSARTPIVIKNTHDVIVRHVRVRLDRLSANRESDDAITIENSRNVVIDHVSASWASDELINGFGDNDNITISNSIFAQGIPRHDKCALLASDPDDSQRLSFIGNICAHNGDRNPDINFPPGSCVEVVNNVFYNAQSEFAEVWESYGGTPVAIVGNTFVKGPDSHRLSKGITLEAIGSRGQARIYLWDNQFLGEFDHINESVHSVQVEQPVCPLTLTPIDAMEAYREVIDNAGAWPRDAFDARIASDIEDRTGRIIDEPGRIVELPRGEPYPDVDEDGMDDRWEARNGANPEIADTWNDSNLDGISNFESFLSYRESIFREAGVR